MTDFTKNNAIHANKSHIIFELNYGYYSTI